MGTSGGIVLEAKLGGEDHLSTKRFERLAYKFLVGEGSVHFSGIEEGDAQVDGFAEEGNHLLFICRLIAKTHSHAAQPESGYFQAAFS